MNWVDVLLLAVFLIYVLEGMGVGFIRGVLDLSGFLLSFALSLKFYTAVGRLLIQQFSLPLGIANALGFFTAAFAFEAIFGTILPLLVRRLPEEFFKSKLNRLSGFIPSLATATILTSFFLTLIVTLPLSPLLKREVTSSKIGGFLLSQTQGFEKVVNQVFGQAGAETINFLTIRPTGTERVNLNFQTRSLSADPISEQRMVELVNGERKKAGLPPLVFDTKLRDVGRTHAKDMFERGYFSHYTPEGLSPFDRMVAANVSFTIAGENLAFAPSVDLAHKGLMESEGHRANILSSDFRKVGIGVIDGGIYGKMFTQEFTD